MIPTCTWYNNSKFIYYHKKTPLIVDENFILNPCMQLLRSLINDIGLIYHHVLAQTSYE